MTLSRCRAILTSLFTLLPICSAWPTSSGYVPPGAKCQDYTTPVNVTSSNYPWIGPRWTDNFGFIDFVSAASSRTDAGFPSPIGAPVNETASYSIGATFCTPLGKPNANAGKILLATHGLAFDRRVSGFITQLNMQTAILAELITAVRSSRYTTLAAPPTTIILVGHSFGSLLTNSLVAVKPTLADAAIMTGCNFNGSDQRLVLQGFAPRVARLQSPKFSAFDAGYITTGDVFGNINNFFKAPTYTHDVAQYSESVKQPSSVAELFSLAPGAMSLNSTAFRGPAFVINGEYDWIVCEGNCVGELEPNVGPLFPNAKNFETYLQPGAGHGTGFATNATGFYGVIFDYLGRNGF